MEPIADILKNSLEGKFPENMKTSSSSSDMNENPGLGKSDCPLCEGLGYVVPDVPPIHPSFGRAIPCTCRAQEREMERLDSLQRLSQLGALQAYTFESFLPEGHGLTESKQANLRRAYNQALDYAKDPQGWLIFKGGYGCGKTHLVAAIANYRINLGHSVLFVNTPDLLDHLRAAYSPYAETGYDERFDQVRNSPLLILDDLGTQSNTDWAQEKLYQIFNYRYNARLPTIVTTNEELEAIEIRVRSRLADPSLTRIIPITALDFRMAGVNQQQSDLSSLNLHSDKTFGSFDMREHELRDTSKASPEKLRDAYEAAVEFAENPTDWLLFHSTGYESYGNGKTHLAAAIANYVDSKGEPVLFIVVPDLLDHLRATFDPANRLRLDKRFDEVKTTSLLILDDLGTESATSWAREKLYQLFNYRYNARLPTVITTAYDIKDLDQHLAARMKDTRRCTWIRLEAPSYGGKYEEKGRWQR